MSTPHARGSTAKAEAERKEAEVYPACAGIHRLHHVYVGTPLRLPRMRGDPPQAKGLNKQLAESTPHARGSTRELTRYLFPDGVYPACAGIHLP